MDGNPFNEYHGITVEAVLCRKDRRWTVWLLPGPWIEQDLRAELDDGMALVVGDGRTNGIYLKQVERGD